MDTYLETSSTTVSWNREENISKDIMSYLQTKKNIVQEIFGGDLNLDVVSETG